MTEIEQLRHGTKKALALLAHALAAAGDARPALENLMQNYKASMAQGQQADDSTKWQPPCS